MEEQFSGALESIMATLGQRGLSIVAGILILGAGYALAGRAGEAAKKLADRSGRLDETVGQLVARLARFGVLGVAIIIALEKFGFETTSLIALVGALGVAIGLALKDTIGDIAAGVVIIILRPFSVGDAIECAGLLGNVTSIDLFETRVLTFDGIPTSLPNSKVRGGVIKNFSRAEGRRFDLVIGIAYEADTKAAIRAIHDVLDKDEHVRDDPGVLVEVQTLADSSVNLLVRGWTAPADFFTTQLRLTHAIKDALDAAGIEIPYPKRNLIVTNDNGPTVAA